jgi:hypothetical protein
MSWKQLLEMEVQFAYGAAEKLVGMVNDEALNWKPSTGANWMTTAQLLKHLGESGGRPMRAFVTGDWGLPPGTDTGEMAGLPKAEEMASVGSVAEAKQLLEADKRMALDTLAACDEASLAHKKAPAPWDPTEMVLGHRLLQMVDHFKQHKGQLFYYLKLQGKPVHTGDLWGM